MLILIADLAGTLVFAIEGALAAMQAGLDVFGVMVLAVVTGSGGGALRDVLIGATPPAAVSDWRYAAVAFTAGAGTFVAGRFIPDVAGQVLLVLDAGGLALFAVAGTGKALACGISPFMATLMGTITGVGGGTMRDVLLMR
ncbi:MAG TPA: TRIC cation channel family protein, partial [Acetobacteraceae bacterium]